MTPERDGRSLRIGEFAARSGTPVDTVRYYERLGLIGSPARTASGYRAYSDGDLGRLQFIRRAKKLGFSLTEIRGLLGLAADGDCKPLRRQVGESLRTKIDECDAKLLEIQAFKASLEERYRLALERQEEPACGCAAFPASCGCLPIAVEELTDARRRPDIGST